MHKYLRHGREENKNKKHSRRKTKKNISSSLKLILLGSHYNSFTFFKLALKKHLIFIPKCFPKFKICFACTWRYKNTDCRESLCSTLIHTPQTRATVFKEIIRLYQNGHKVKPIKGLGKFYHRYMFYCSRNSLEFKVLRRLLLNLL